MELMSIISAFATGKLNLTLPVELFRHFMGTEPEMADRIRLEATRDLAWALVNSPAFLFNR